MLKLREYVERGGTILAEPSDHSKPFAESMERLLRDMYPPKDYPSVKLEALAADHPILQDHLQPLRRPGGELPPPLHRMEIVFGDRPFEERLRQNVRRRNRVLDR